MGKEELARRVAAKRNITKNEAGAGVDALFEVMEEAIRNQEKISVHQFFVMEVKHRAPRMARNPNTGEVIPIGDRWAATCRFSRPFQDLGAPAV